MTFTYQRLWKEWVDFLEESGALSELSLNDRDVDSRYGRLKTLRNLFVEQQRFLKQLVMAIDFSTHLLGTLEEFQTKIVTGITTSLKRPKPTCFEDYLVLENSISRLLDLSRSLINEAVLDKG